MEIRDLADELQAILDGERPRLNKAEMREYLECLRAFAPIAAQDEAVLEIGECAEVIWHQGGPCQLPPGAKLYPRSEPKYIEEIAEALGDPTLISLSQVATGIRDLKAERARVPAGWKIQVDGNRVHVTKPDGAVTEWHHRPTANGSGMYDLCRALATPPEDIDHG